MLVNEHLHLIYAAAPDRVGIYGLINQDNDTKTGTITIIFCNFLFLNHLLFPINYFS
jgi:hypothetical protein